jgi:NitT/TauT family transport system ATP-binding protein
VPIQATAIEATTQQPRVTVRRLSKAFDGGTDVFRDISFDVAPGSIVALLGPSGCGKTTLVRILCGLECPSSGSVHVGGQNPDSLRKEGKVGMAFQEPALFPWRTVCENIALPLEITKQRNNGSIQRLVKLLRLDGAEDLRPSQLSGGMAQRVAVARALVTQPELLLLDEPFGALDWFLRRQIIVDFEGVWLNERSTTVIVTHETREAVFLADKLIILSSSPATILATIDVQFPRPRPSSIFASTQFHALCDMIDSTCEVTA